jgi:hypothetical protein
MELGDDRSNDLFKGTTMKARTSRKFGRPKPDVTPYVTELLETINGGKTILQFQKTRRSSVKEIRPRPFISFKPAK